MPRSAHMPLSGLMLAIFTLLLAGPQAHCEEVHPQDGPHADVRILIEETGVTFNIMMNLVFTDEIVDAPREDPDVLHPIEAPALRDALLEYFTAENHVRIDGVEVTPILKDFERMEPDRSLLALFPISGVRGISKVRISLAYPAKSMPQEVAMMWAAYPVDVLFSTPIEEVLLQIAAEVTAEGLKSNIMFTSSEPEFTWHATGETIEDRFMAVPETLEPEMWGLPAASMGVMFGLLILLIGARSSSAWATLRKPLLLLITPLFTVAAVLLHNVGTVEVRSPFEDAGRLPTPDEALAIFEPLHANIYRAFDYTQESDIYDALARSVDGALLDDLYNQIYRSLILYEEGGAVSRVEKVTPIEQQVGAIGTMSEYGDAIGFHVTARWDVLGMVYHWGHSHSRLNQYLAEYTVIDTADGWRIADNRVIEQQRVNLDEPAAAGSPDIEI